MKHKEVSYMITGINKDLWQRVKMQALIQDVTIKELVIKALTNYVQEQEQRRGG